MYSLSPTFFLVQLTPIMNLETESCGADLHSTLTNIMAGRDGKDSRRTTQRRSTPLAIWSMVQAAWPEFSFCCSFKNSKRDPKLDIVSGCANNADTYSRVNKYPHMRIN
jgi:hypothetical protein